MKDPKRIAILLDEFGLHSPGQQLLDRFLVGFPQNGEFHPPAARVVLFSSKAADPALIGERTGSFGLIVAPTAEEALRSADAVVIGGAALGSAPPESLVRLAVEQAPAGTPIFVYGLLASSPGAAADLRRKAAGRGCPTAAGTALPFAFRLPDVDLPEGARVREAVIVVQGEFPSAELDGLEGLLPVIERRKHAGSSLRQLRYLEGDALWRAGEKGAWSWPLLAAALSRSDTPQGNAVLDGRTEDLVGLGLVAKLAQHPRGWLLEHQDGLRSAILVLDGVVADINLAIGIQNGPTISAQLFRPPPPQREQYSRLAVALWAFFSSGRQPWPMGRALAEANAMAAMHSPEARAGKAIDLR